jgi:uncharacterized membrane protein
MAFIIDTLLGIGGKLVDRLVPDKNKKQDQDHEVQTKQIDATIEGERNSNWTPRKILMMLFAIPALLNFVVKPTVEWVSLVVGNPVKLPGVEVGPTLQIVIGLLGL